jgi:hypothetical protein
MTSVTKIFATIVAVVSIACGSVAMAANVPSFAHPNSEQIIRGRIQSINGTYRISVLDDNSHLVDSVELHQGTIINPAGLKLEPGMHVTVLGYNAGSVFEANEIDTPYHYSAVPVPVYCGPGWWYPGYPYGYCPSFSISVVGGVVVQRPFRRQPWAPHPVPPYIDHIYIGRPR